MLISHAYSTESVSTVALETHWPLYQGHTCTYGLTCTKYLIIEQMSVLEWLEMSLYIKCIIIDVVHVLLHILFIGIFLHTIATHWIFSLLGPLSVNSRDGCDVKTPVDQQFVKHLHVCHQQPPQVTSVPFLPPFCCSLWTSSPRLHAQIHWTAALWFAD